MNNTLASEDVLLDFDGWLGRQKDETRSSIEQHLALVPEGSRVGEKQKLASMFAIASSENLDSATVADNWDMIRGGFAEREAAFESARGSSEHSGQWMSVKDDEAGFFGAMQKRAQFQRDERQLILGPDNPRFKPLSIADNLVTSGLEAFTGILSLGSPWGLSVVRPPKPEIDDTERKKSLAFRAQDAALSGQTMAEALAGWQAESNGKPGFDPREANRHLEIARQIFDRTAALADESEPVARELRAALVAKAGGATANREPVAILRNLSPEVKQMAFELIRRQTKPLGMKEGESFLEAQALFESVGRAGGGLLGGWQENEWREKLRGVQFAEGQDTRKTLQAIKTLGLLIPGADDSDAPVAQALRALEGKTGTLTKEDAEKLNQHIADELEDSVTREMAQNFMEGTIDPVDVGNVVFRKLVRPAADSAAIMATMAIPGAQLPAFEVRAQSYANDEYIQLRMRGMDDKQAASISSWSGLAEAGLDLAAFNLLTKGFPTLTGRLREFSLRGSEAARLAGAGAGIFGGETSIEIGQDIVIPMLIQDIVATDPRWDVTTADIWTRIVREGPDIAMGMVLLSAMGAMGQVSGQNQIIAGADPAVLLATGYTPEQVLEIFATPAEDRAAYLSVNAPAGLGNPKAQARAAVAAARDGQAAFRERRNVETVASSEAADFGIRLTRTASGWQVMKADGSTVTVNTVEAARVLRKDLALAATQQGAEGIIALLDGFHAKLPENTRRETTVTGEDVRAMDEGLLRSRSGAAAELQPMTAQAMDELYSESRLLADNTGGGEIEIVVNGSNAVEFRTRVADGVRETIQRLELNNGEPIALTAIHERVEAVWRTAVESGRISVPETQKAIGSLAFYLNPEQARTPEERGFRERVQKIARGEASETELRETLSELAVSDVVGRRKDGSFMPAGSITAAVTDAIEQATTPEEIGLLGRFRAFLRAVRTQFRAVFGTLAALQRARIDQSSQSWDALMNKLLEFDEQEEHDAELSEEISDYIPPTPEEEEMGIAFRLSTTKRLEAFQRRLDTALARDPDRRRVLGVQAAKKLQTLAFNWETDRMTPMGDRIRPVVERRSKSELNKEQAVQEAFRREELEAEVYTRHSNVFGNEDMASLWSSPLMQALFRPEGTPLHQGILRSKASASRSSWFDEKQGEYDGAEDLPRFIFGGNTMPDQAAQELYDAGLLREPTPDALWNAIRKEIERAEKWKEFVKVAKEDLKRAKDQAHEEAFEWRRRQDEMQAKDWSPRARLLRDLRTLDAIIAVLPPELRGKVGGFVKLAALSTDEARANEINRRIDKLGELVEDYLKTETTEAMERLLERASPSREAGKQSRGKIGAEAHRFLDQVAAVMPLSLEQVEAKRGEIEAGYSDVNLTDARALDLAEQEQILDTFGAWEKKSAADMGAAFRTADAVYNSGRNRWRMIEEQRLAEVARLAEELVEAMGGVSIAGIQQQKDPKGARLRVAGRTALDFKSFTEVMDELLGKDHPLARRWSRAARDGFARKNDEVLAMRQRWKAALETATGEKGVAARRLLWDMANNQAVEVETAGRLNPRTDQVPVSIIDTWIDGTGDPEALGYSQTEADNLILEREAMDAEDRRELLTLDRSSRETSEKVKMTEAEGLFLTMLRAQDQYAAALDRDGWTQPVIDAIEDQLSEPAKRLRDFIRSEYREGYAPLASIFESMYGVALPQIKNYAPAAFYHVGAERDSGPLERGGVGSGMRAGFLANRKQHTAAPRLENAFATFFGHAEQSAHWKALAPFVREFSGVLARPDVKRAIEGKHGKEMLKILAKWVESIEGNGLATASGSSGLIVSALTSAQSYIALAYNFGTLMKQSTAALGAAYRMPARAYARGFARLVSGQLDVAKVFNSPVIQRRLQTGFAPEVRAALNDIWTAKPTLRAEFLRRGMDLIGLTDAIFTTGSAAIAYDYHFNEAKKAGLPADSADLVAMREVEDIVGRTAQPSDIVDRSTFEAELGPFGRLLFLFASEPRQKASLWLTAVKNTATGTGTKDDARVLAISHLLVGPMLWAITAAWRDARDDDDDELFDSENWNGLDFIRSIALGPMSGLPLLRDVVSGFRDDGVLGRFIEGFTATKDLLGGPSENDAETAEWYLRRITRIMKATDAFTGVTGNVLNQTFNITDNLLPDSDEEEAKKLRAAARREIKEAREQ